MVPKVEVREPIDEALQCGRLDTFGAADDAQHPAEVEPGQVTVGCFAGGQVKGEVGRRRTRVRILGQRSHPSGRPFQERNRARQLAAMAAQDRCADAQHQTHVVVEGQPRHDRGIRCGLGVGLREEAAHQLLEIHLKVAVRDHDPGRQPGRTRAVLQIRDAGQIGCPKACSAIGIQIHRIDFDDLRSSVQACLIDVFGDIFRDRGRRENNRGRRIGKDRTYPLVTRAAMRQRERNRDEPGLHGSQESQRCNRGPAGPGSLPGLRPTHEG